MEENLGSKRLEDLFERLSQAIQEGEHTEVAGLVEQALAKGVDPLEILRHGMIPGMQALGERFKTDKIFA